MLELNKVMLVGRLTRDPERRMFGDGNGVTNFSLAVGRRYRNRTGEYVEETAFIDMKAFGRSGEFAEQYLRRGTGVYVEGRMVQENWEKDGQKRSKLLVHVDRIQFAESRVEQEARMSRSGGDTQGGGGGYSDGGGGGGYPQGPGSGMPPMPGGSHDIPGGGTNDDLPF